MLYAAAVENRCSANCGVPIETRWHFKKALMIAGRQWQRFCFRCLYAEFSALQSSSAELRTQLETLQPDISALKNIRKYIDMVLNKQQLSAPGGKTPEKESVLKKLEEVKAAQSQKKAEQKNHTQEL